MESNKKMGVIQWMDLTYDNKFKMYIEKNGN